MSLLRTSRVTRHLSRRKFNSVLLCPHFCVSWTRFQSTVEHTDYELALPNLAVLNPLQNVSALLNFLSISTLNPKNLQPSDYLDLSGLSDVTVGPNPSKASPLEWRPWHAQAQNHAGPFPTNTRGFLYHFQHENLPLTTSELRFRLIPDLTTSFTEGTDLLISPGVPWSIPIYRLSLHEKYTALRDILLQDNLVTQEWVEWCQSVYPTAWTDKPKNIVIHALRQPFIVPVYRRRYGMWIVGQDRVLDLKFDTSFLGQDGPFRKRNLKYTGPAVVCLDYDRERRVFVTEIVEPPGREPGKGPSKIIKGTRHDLVWEPWHDDPVEALSLLLLTEMQRQ